MNEQDQSQEEQSQARFNKWWKFEVRDKLTGCFSYSSRHYIKQLCRTAWENGQLNNGIK